MKKISLILGVLLVVVGAALRPDAMFGWLGLLLVLVLAVGCTNHQNLENTKLITEIESGPDIFYCDGAGRGDVDGGWGKGINQGLRQAGFGGDFYVFRWNTGQGMVADQQAPVAYKRKMAKRLAAIIARYIDDNPNEPCVLIGLSAGAAVAMFTLEELPPGKQVDNVVMVGASVSSQYDLSKALKHVRHKFYNFDSERDVWLEILVPPYGMADHGPEPAAGLEGFQLPTGANDETKQLYADKLQNIIWDRSFEKEGNYGGHLDAATPRFVKEVIAPLILVPNSTTTQPSSAPLSPKERSESEAKPGEGVGCHAQPRSG